jgi:hypothetical protein
MKSYGLKLLYGIQNPEPVIPGFAVEASPRRFLMAIQAGKRFYAERREQAFRLFPQIPSGGLHRHQAITIPI